MLVSLLLVFATAHAGGQTVRWIVRSVCRCHRSFPADLSELERLLKLINRSRANVLFGHPAVDYIGAMDGMTLPPELERYADEAVAAGRFHDRAGVVAAGIKLLQQADIELAEFIKSLEDARAEADCNGWVSLSNMVTEMDEVIQAKAARAP